jgi:hypothetical protein
MNDIVIAKLVDRLRFAAAIAQRRPEELLSLSTETKEDDAAHFRGDEAITVTENEHDAIECVNFLRLFVPWMVPS